MSQQRTEGPVQSAIIEKLQALAPSHLEVANESHGHNVPAGSESHFKVVLVSEAFSGLRQVPRHQKIYGLLAEEMAGPVHALALHTFSPEEWSEQAVPESPNCLGGSLHDKKSEG
ncbi:MAG: BolA/IbaG family iron-sulfur metabolism protein [Cellvibrionaceae bacterium]|nr:BolA/IbaG family iron-sulfur metabolism protein [Cellvibrionaceae bacterium]